jgi:hypothetical protein
MTSQQIEYVIRERKAGKSQTELATEVGVSVPTIHRYVRQIPLPTRQCFQCGKVYQPKTVRSNFCSRVCQLDYKRGNAQ